MVAVALTAVYFAWFRDSSLVKVERVTITGLATPEASRLNGELQAAALRMTSLDVDEGALLRAVHGNPLVRSISADGQFPHAVRIDVTLNLPVAILTAGPRALPVAADGTLLPSVQAGSLPTVALHGLPRGRRLTNAQSLALVNVAAAAPAPLRARLAVVTAIHGEGVVARIAQGPAIIFGDDLSDVPAKWEAAASVLAQPSSSGASYVDVRAPQMPVAGGLTLPDAPQPDAQPDPSNPASPGAISAAPSAGTGLPSLPATAVPSGQGAPAQGVGTAGPTTAPPSATGAATPPATYPKP